MSTSPNKFYTIERSQAGLRWNKPIELFNNSKQKHWKKRKSLSNSQNCKYRSRTNFWIQFFKHWTNPDRASGSSTCKLKQKLTHKKEPATLNSLHFIQITITQFGGASTFTRRAFSRSDKIVLIPYIYIRNWEFQTVRCIVVCLRRAYYARGADDLTTAAHCWPCHIIIFFCSLSLVRNRIELSLDCCWPWWMDERMDGLGCWACGSVLFVCRGMTWMNIWKSHCGRFPRRRPTWMAIMGDILWGNKTIFMNK